MICEVNHYKRCTNPSILIYAAFSDVIKEIYVCEKHWELHCDNASKFNLREHFKK